MVPGKVIGKYTDASSDKGDMIDVTKPVPVTIKDARQMEPLPTLDNIGFQLLKSHTQMLNFRDDD
jgi:hypothetical protein